MKSFTHLQGFASVVKKAQLAEIEEGIKTISEDPEHDGSDPAALFENADFTADDLDNFSVGEKGVTFIYDYGFPHVIQACQPSGNYFFTWNELKPYIKPGGLPTRLAR